MAFSLFQSFDKAGFHAGTPPPYGLTMPTGTQAGPMAAPTGPYGTPYVPVLPHQQHSQMMHHHLQQVKIIFCEFLNLVQVLTLVIKI